MAVAVARLAPAASPRQWGGKPLPASTIMRTGERSLEASEPKLGVDGLPGFGFVFDNDGAGVGRDAVLLFLFEDFVGWDSDQPEEGADGPVQADADQFEV